MLIWLSILLLLDAGCALWFENRIHPFIPKGWNIRIIAMLEASLALALAIWHYRGNLFN